MEFDLPTNDVSPSTIGVRVKRGLLIDAFDERLSNTKSLKTNQGDVKRISHFYDKDIEIDVECHYEDFNEENVKVEPDVHIKSEKEFEATLKRDLSSRGFTFLCPDGRFASLNSTVANATCSWIEDLRPVIIARRTGLKSIVELMPHSAARDEANVVAAIVRKKSSFKKFADLKGARVCFAGLRSVGWNAFYYRMTNKTIGKRSDCSDVGFVANYFKRSCVQGVDKSKFPVHLTTLCKRTKANLSNDEKTFRCLAEDGGDVAFVNYTAAKGYAARNRTIFTNQYRLLCPEENSTDRSCPLSCLRMIRAGTADFTVLEPEDLSLATLSTTSKEGDAAAAVDIRVTHELKMFGEGKPQLDVEMIALVKNRFDNRWVTKNKKLCYIGLEIGHSQNYHYHYTTYFERWLIPRGCDRNKTLLENRLADLSSHFESACIAGPWSLDSVYDGRLKSKYRNLCALCGSPSGCFEGDKFYGLQGAINCLLENVGDIAWLSRSHAVPYFAELASYGFSLLCPDGMFIPLSVNKTCTWIAEPRSVIAARSDVADLVSKKVSDVQELGKDFYPVIHATYKFSHLAETTPPLSPEDYMLKFQGYLSAKGEKTCQPEREVRWCVASNLEASKCGWLQSAAAALDVEPRISCIQQRDRQAALDAVRDDRCDVFVARPQEEIHARGMNLTPIVHLISKQNLDSSRFAAIVRKDAKFRSFDDLKGKRACFTGIKSVGWNAFYSAIRGSSPRLPCDDVEAVSRFFNQSCVYDLADEKRSSVPENLYSLCNQSHFEKSLGPEENTFKCLMNGADVAFVNVGAAKRYYSGFSIFHMNYRTLCENEDRLDEEPCFLAETTLGSDQTQLIQRHVSDLRHSRTYEEVLASLQDKVECGLSGAPTVASSAWMISAIAVLGLLRILNAPAAAPSIWPSSSSPRSRPRQRRHQLPGVVPDPGLLSARLRRRTALQVRQVPDRHADGQRGGLSGAAATPGGPRLRLSDDRAADERDPGPDLSVAQPE
ncbi:unnamed protein product [Trichogramma brassicae]|uniref:Transferrin-like domain-containing protein n=1 Tax=Trichogramma brassicae TaxID=86971 RepID=A0A6H5I2Q4_9HYME|nr:unnamed protein product [Trichogramma brassicae]